MPHTAISAVRGWYNMSLYSRYLAPRYAQDPQSKKHSGLATALVILGVLLILSSFYTTTSIHYTYIPDGQGGIIPYPITSTEHPYAFAWMPGLFLLIFAALLAVPSKKDRLAKQSAVNGGEVNSGPFIQTDESNHGVYLPQIPSSQTAMPEKTEYCRYCGHRTTTDATFCEKCGERLS